MVRAAGDVDGDAAAAVGEGATFDQRGRRAIPAARRLALMLDDDARRDARFAQCDCGGVGLLVVVAGGSINSDVPGGPLMVVAADDGGVRRLGARPLGG